MILRCSSALIQNLMPPGKYCNSLPVRLWLPVLRDRERNPSRYMRDTIEALDLFSQIVLIDPKEPNYTRLLPLYEAYERG